MRRMYGCPCAAYFDDYDITDQVAARRSGKEALHYVHQLFGIALSGGDKDVDPAAANPFLGVISDLSSVVEGIAVMRSKPSRVAAIMVAAMEMVVPSKPTRQPARLFRLRAELHGPLHRLH